MLKPSELFRGRQTHKRTAERSSSVPSARTTLSKSETGSQLQILIEDTKGFVPPSFPSPKENSDNLIKPSEYLK